MGVLPGLPSGGTLSFNRVFISLIVFLSSLYAASVGVVGVGILSSLVLMISPIVDPGRLTFVG